MNFPRQHERTPAFSVVSVGYANALLMPRALRVVAVTMACGAIIYFFSYVAPAWRFEWPLDYGEGPLLDQARRVAAGQAIYPASFGEYGGLVSNYPFVYPSLLALAGTAFGFSLHTARALTAISVCICAWAISGIVRHITNDTVAGLIAVGLFLASPVVLFWSMFARVDFVALALTLSSLLLVTRRPRTRATPYVTSALLMLAVFTRQSQLVAGPLSIALALALASRRSALVFVTTFVSGLVALVLVMQALTHGGFWLHVVTANVQAYSVSNVFSALARFMCTSGPLVVLSAWAMLDWRRASRAGSANARLPYVLLGTFLIGAFVSSLTIGKVGSGVNHLLPFVAALSMLGGVAFARAGRARTIARHRPRARVVATVALVAVVGQIPWMILAATIDSPDGVARKLARGRDFAQLAQIVRSSPPPILADESMGVLVLADRAPPTDPFNLTQLVRARMNAQDALVVALRAQRFSVVLVDDGPTTSASTVAERWTPEMLAAIHDAYQANERLATTTVYRPKQ